MSILKILNELGNDPSGNAKKAILQREVKNLLLRDVFTAAYNPYISYYQKKIPEYTAGKCFPQLTLPEAMGHLACLVNRQYTGYAAINHLGWVLTNCSANDAEVIERIIARDLRCGCSDSTSNKIWPDSVPGFDVMLAHKDISGIRFPAYCQEKSDGMRVHVHYDGVALTLFTRSGKTVTTHGVLDATAKIMMEPGETFDGELVCYKNGKPLDRKTSNGFGNKGVKGTITKEEAEMFRLVTWDIVDFSGTERYDNRFTSLESRFKRKISDGRFILIPCIIIESVEEADSMFAAALAAGKEGCVLKNMDSVWQPKRTKDLGKMKATEEADLIIISWYKGNEGRQFEDDLGGFVCQTSDGLLEVNVGGGYSEDERFDKKLRKEKIGTIMTVAYNAIIDSKGKAKKSLFLPRKIEFRLDKTVANSLDELK